MKKRQIIRKKYPTVKKQFSCHEKPKSEYYSHSQLVFIQNDKAVIGKKYDVFIKTVKNQFEKCDYLILAGDILDFSIAPYENAYKCARVFFEQIVKDKITDKVIYIPGNHDADIWHIIQHQRHVINKIIKGNSPETFQHSVAGILDDRSNSSEEFTLDGVSIKKDDDKKYGGMYFDGITGTDITREDTVKDITFYFAYPNLYIVTDKENVLVTHGHYLEYYWSFMREIIDENDLKADEDDLKNNKNLKLNENLKIGIEESVALNFPLNQLACTGIGQAGILTKKVIRPIELDIKKKDFNRIENYLNRLVNLTENRIAKLATKVFIYISKKFLIAKLEKIESTRFNENFIKENKDRFEKFYQTCLSEINSINAEPQFSNRKLPIPYKILFGHTHLPTSWEKPGKPFSDKNLTFYNTGGWLSENSEFKGAEIFFYETGKGFSSVSIT